LTKSNLGKENFYEDKDGNMRARYIKDENGKVHDVQKERKDHGAFKKENKRRERAGQAPLSRDQYERQVSDNMEQKAAGQKSAERDKAYQRHVSGARDSEGRERYQVETRQAFDERLDNEEQARETRKQEKVDAKEAKRVAREEKRNSPEASAKRTASEAKREARKEINRIQRQTNRENFINEYGTYKTDTVLQQALSGDNVMSREYGSNSTPDYGKARGKFKMSKEFEDMMDREEEEGKV